MRRQYPVPLMSRVVEVSARGYDAGRERPPADRAQENARLEVEIKAAHTRTRQPCGPERVPHELAEHGVHAGVYRITRLRKKRGIRGQPTKQVTVTTDSRHTLPVAAHVLDQPCEAATPHHVWVSAMTDLPTDEGWRSLAGHKDLFTGDIVGSAMGERITKHLVSQSLCRAVTSQRPRKGLIHHSDRGSQSCAYEYQALLGQCAMHASMSRTGTCYDNAPMERVWGTLTQERVHHRRYSTRQEAIQDITEYIEVFSSRQRRQARLGFLSPAVYAQQYYAEQLAA